jgi:peptide/nickel transport system substrate-binding protein
VSSRRHHIILAVLLALLGACSLRGNSRTGKDEVVVLGDAEIRDLDPRFSSSENDVKLSRLCAPGLTTVDHASMEPIPLVAERVTQLDSLTWEVAIRPGWFFPDGTEVSADDVVYTYTSTLDPALGSTSRKAFSERFTSVEKVTDRLVRFHLKQPLGTFVTDLEFGIVSAKAAQSAPNAGGRFKDRLVVGAGAYTPVRLTEWEVVLERNEHFTPLAPLKRVVVRVLRDANARVIVLVGGSADVAQNTVRADLVDEIVKEAPWLEIERSSSVILTYLAMHNEDPLLKDVRVRKAIGYAIDRDKIIRGKLGGYAVPATGLIAPGHWAYNGDVARYGYDPARAKRLLDEAGHPDPDGDGPRPRFTLTFKTSSDLQRLSIARLIAQDLGAVGIEVDVRAFEFATFFADLKRGNYQLGSMQTSLIVEPDMYHNHFHSSRIPSKEFPDVGNRWRYRNPEADRLIDAGRAEGDRAKRREIYGQLQALVAEDLPIVPLWHEDNIAIRHHVLESYEVLPNARLITLGRVAKP